MLALIGRGLSDAEIAAEHGLSQATAQKHRSNLLRKLGVAGSAKLTAYAIEHGFARIGPVRPGPRLSPTAALLPPASVTRCCALAIFYRQPIPPGREAAERRVRIRINGTPTPRLVPKRIFQGNHGRGINRATATAYRARQGALKDEEEGRQGS